VAPLASAAEMAAPSMCHAAAGMAAAVAGVISAKAVVMASCARS
jgi:hypothetical protein